VLTWKTLGRYRVGKHDVASVSDTGESMPIHPRLLLPDAGRYVLVKLVAAIASTAVGASFIVWLILALCDVSMPLAPSMISAVFVGLLWGVVGLMKPLPRPLSQDLLRW